MATSGVEFKLPLTWEDVKLIANNPYIIVQCLRSPEVDAIYQKESQDNKEFLSTLKTTLDVSKHLFTHAKYPYHVQSPIIHRIMWLKNMSEGRQWVDPYDMETIKKLIEEDMTALGFTKYLLFQNPPQYRSVALLPHYHIFYCDPVEKLLDQLSIDTNKNT